MTVEIGGMRVSLGHALNASLYTHLLDEPLDRDGDGDVEHEKITDDHERPEEDQPSERLRYRDIREGVGVTKEHLPQLHRRVIHCGPYF